MDTNSIRLCSHSRWVFIYWLEELSGLNLSEEQVSIINTHKKTYVGWLLATSGYYDKSISGNWQGHEIANLPVEKIIDKDTALNSPVFKKFLRELHYIVMRRTNPRIWLVNMRNKEFDNKLNTELDLFKKYIFPENIPDCIKFREEVDRNFTLSPDELFKFTANKRVLIINLYADLFRDHYNSGKIIQWYTKYSEYNPCNIPSFTSISSLEIPYPFGNGINEKVYNNFFETLDLIKSKIDLYEDYDIALISAGIYTSFIADYIDKAKNKQFSCYGRDLNHIFCIKYKHTYTWCTCEFTKSNLEPYLCSIPGKYRLDNCSNVEDAGYW
jgi:hypothetical protein